MVRAAELLWKSALVVDQALKDFRVMTGRILSALPHAAPKGGVAPVSSSESLANVQVASATQERTGAPASGVDSVAPVVSTRVAHRFQEEVVQDESDIAMAILPALIRLQTLPEVRIPIRWQKAVRGSQP